MTQLPTNAIELMKLMMAAKRQIDEALDEYHRAILEDARADRAASIAYSTAYLTSAAGETKETVGEKEARANQATADIRSEARLAEGLKRSAGKALDSKMQWLSALQSAASAMRAEAQLAKYEPSETRTP